MSELPEVDFCKLRELLQWYESLCPENLYRIPEFYTEDAVFTDPFNDVSGQQSIEHIFRHMFENVKNPRFVIQSSTTGESDAWVSWVFFLGAGKKQLQIEGASRLVFADDGRVCRHKDYWDSSVLMSIIPGLGLLSRVFKKQLAAS